MLIPCSFEKFAPARYPSGERMSRASFGVLRGDVVGTTARFGPGRLPACLLLFCSDARRSRCRYTP